MKSCSSYYFITLLLLSLADLPTRSPETPPYLAAPLPSSRHPPLRCLGLESLQIPVGHILALPLISLLCGVQAQPLSWKPRLQQLPQLPRRAEAAPSSSVSFPGDTP